jgi:hypothetical protein
MSSLTTVFNNSNSLSVIDTSFSIAQLKQSFDVDASNAFATRVKSIESIEQQVLVALAKGRSSVTFTGPRDNNPFRGTEDLDFKNHVLVNNVAIDTPNVAIMSYQVDASFETHSYDSTIGTDLSSTTVKAPVYDFSNSTVYVDENLVLTFRQPTTNDSTNDWTVEFSGTPEKNLSRAVNSNLNAKSGGVGVNPVTATDPSFNKLFALCGQGSTGAFNTYYSNTAGSIPVPQTFAYRNNVIRNPSVSQNLNDQLFSIDVQQNNTTGPFIDSSETGTYRFILQEPNGGIVVSDYRNGVQTNTGSNLPFLVVEPNGNNSLVDENISTTDFNKIFYNIKSEDTFSFSLDTSANGGGYFFTTDISNINTLESTYIYNNYDYMKNYINQTPALYIRDGSIAIDALSNSVPATQTFFANCLQTRGENLNSTNYNQNGLITLHVKPVTDRVVKDVSAVATGELFKTMGSDLRSDLSAVIVSYDASDNDYINLNSLVTSDLSASLQDINLNDEDLIHADVTTITAMKLFDGCRNNDASYCYLDASGVTLPKSTPYVDGKSIIYSSHQFASNQFDYSVQNPSGQIMFIQMLSSQSLQETAGDVSGLYFLNRDQAGNAPSTIFYDDDVDHRFDNKRIVADISGYYYQADALQGAKLQTDVAIDSFTLSDLSYSNYRVLLLPKTIDDLQINISGGAELIYGYPSQDRIYEDTSATYATMKSQNQEFILGENEFEASRKEIPIAKHGLNVFDLSTNAYEFDTNDNTNTNATIKNTNENEVYTYEVKFDIKDPLVWFTLQGDDDTRVRLSRREFQTSAIQDWSGNLLKYYIKLPFGHYDNVYIHTTQYLEKTEYASNFRFKISFTQKTLFGLKAFLQGGGGPGLLPSNPYDISSSWTNINTTPIHVDSLSRYLNLDNPLDHYYKIANVKSTGSIPYTDPLTNTSSSGTISITIKQNMNNDRNYDSDRYLFHPGYVIPLVDNPDTQISNQFIGHIVKSADLTTTFANTFWDNISFNPANTLISDRSQLDLTLSNFTDLNLNVDVSLNGFQRVFTVTSPQQDISGFKMILKMPYNTPTNMNMWYCPNDIWGTQVVGDSTTYSKRTVLANSINSQVQLAKGVALTNITKAKPGSRVTFQLRNQSISIQPVTSELLTDGSYNRFDLNGTVMEMSGNLNNLGKNVVNSQKTQFFNLGTQYRGYHSNSSGTLDVQTYQITRNVAQYQFVLNRFSTEPLYAGGIGFQDLYSNLSINDITFNDYFLQFPSNGTDFGFGLRSTFNLSSINGDGAEVRYDIDIVGDPVTVTTVTNNVPLANSSPLTLKNFNLFDSSYSFVAGRVTAGTDGTTWTGLTRYNLSKAEQQVKIDFYSNQYYSDPSNQSWLANPTSTTFKNNSLLLPSQGGVQLSPSITLNLPSAYYLGLDTKGVFLVSTPPVVTFTALAYSAAHFKYDGLRLVPFDVSGISSNTYTLPMFNSNSQFNPYSGTSGMNNITYSRSSIIFSLGYYFSLQSLPSTTSIPIQGNQVLVQRKNLSSTQLLDNATLPGEGTSYVSISSLATPDVSGGYTLTYRPTYTTTSGIVQYYIGSAFCQGTFTIEILSRNATNTTLYGIAPYIDTNNKYQLQAYKFVDTIRRNNYSIYSQSTTPNIYDQHAVKRYVCNITVPDVSFGSNPFNLLTQRGTITTSQLDLTPDQSLNWVQDSDFSEKDINFSLTAISTLGNTKIADQFNLFGDGPVIKLKYLSMPDVLQVLDADRSTVFRITYNGSLASTLISTTSVNINQSNFSINASNNNNSLASPYNAIFGDYEVDTFNVIKN